MNLVEMALKCSFFLTNFEVSILEGWSCFRNGLVSGGGSSTGVP